MITKKILGKAGSVTNAAVGIATGITGKTVNIANQIVSKIPGVETVKIPKDLSEVIRYEEETPPGDLGLNDDCVENIWEAAEGLYRSQLHNQIALCVRREGEIILNRSIGVARGQYGDEGAVIGSTDTPFCLFSASKAVSALLLCKLEELNELSLNDTITKYIPGFGKHGKEDITLSELISHRAKIPSFDVDGPDVLADHDYMLDHLCNSRPIDAKQAYHAITGGFIISEVIERVTGRPVQSALTTYFRKPLGMKYFTYGLQKRYREKFSEAHVSGVPLLGPLQGLPLKILGLSVDEVVEFSNQDAFLSCSLPAGNMFATAEECSRFYQMLLDDGVYNNQQVLHPDTIKKALGGDFLPSWDETFGLPAHFSRGGFMRNTPPTMLFGFNAPSAYGHLGFINILTWADPQRKISVGLVTSGKPFLGPHLYNFLSIPNTIGYNIPRR